MKKLLLSLLTVIMMSSTAVIMADGPDDDKIDKDKSFCETVEYCRRHIDELDQKILDLLKPHAERRAKALEVLKKEIGRSAQALRILVSKMKDSFFANEALNQYVRIYPKIESALRKSDTPPAEIDQLLYHVTLDYEEMIANAFKETISSLLVDYIQADPHYEFKGLRNRRESAKVELDGQAFMISRIYYGISDGQLTIEIINFLVFRDNRFYLASGYMRSGGNVGDISIKCTYNNKGLVFDIDEGPVTEEKVLEVLEEGAAGYGRGFGVLDIRKNAKYEKLMEIRSRYQKILDVLQRNSEGSQK